MTNFAQAASRAATETRTENGAKARNTSMDALVDLFATIGSLRSRSESEIETLFAEAYKEDPLIATKILFYARDIRGGLGERNTFRVILKYLAQYHPEAVRPNLDLIGVFGRYDDLYCLVGTNLEADMWKAMKAQWDEDLSNLAAGNAVSLLAKWIKTPDASSKQTRKLGIATATNLGYSVYEFKRKLRALRTKINIVERYMSAGEWDKITYSNVPSRAMLIYRNSFMRHDDVRYNEFVSKAITGEEKINSAALFPYDLVKKIMPRYGSAKDDATVEAQWRQLPNYVEPGTNAIVLSDLSGSMTWDDMVPMASSIGLAIYFAEKNVGAYQNLFIPFSDDSKIVSIKGDTLAQKINYVLKAGHDYCGSTNLESAFDEVLKVAVKNNVPKDEMVKSLIIISDMEINSAVDEARSRSWSFYELMKKKFAKAGYDIPNVVFWNANSKHDAFHADANRPGVQLVSGKSASTFKNLLSVVGMTPIEAMMKIINADRYSVITVS